MAYTLNGTPKRGIIGAEIELRVDNDWHGPCLYNTQETAVAILMSPIEARALAAHLLTFAKEIDEKASDVSRRQTNCLHQINEGCTCDACRPQSKPQSGE